MNSEKGLGMYSLASDVTKVWLIPQMHIIYLRKYFARLPTEWFITFMHSYYVKFAVPCLGGETVKHVSKLAKEDVFTC